MKQNQFEERKKAREANLEESRTKFKEDNADQIDAYNKYVEEKKAKEEKADKLLKELKRHCYRSQQVFVRCSRAYTNSSIYIFIINKIYRSSV